MKNLKKHIKIIVFNQYILLVFILLNAHYLSAQLKNDDILGKWLTEKRDAVVHIFKTSDGKYAGKIIWVEKPLENGKPITDKNNPKPELRSKPIVGLIFMGGFIFEHNEWTGGIIYDAESGNTYKAKISMKDKNTLDLRGYVGAPMFGRTTTWKRRADK